MNCICLKMRLENECCHGKRLQVWDTNLNRNKCHKKGFSAKIVTFLSLSLISILRQGKSYHFDFLFFNKKNRRGPKLKGCAFANFGNSIHRKSNPSCMCNLQLTKLHLWIAIPSPHHWKFMILQPWYQIGSEWCCNRQNNFTA